MKQTIFAMTAAAAIALGATLAAAQSDETNKKPSAATIEQQTAPKTSTKAQSEQTQPRRELRSTAEEKGREAGATTQTQKKQAQHPRGAAQTQTPTQPKREKSATGKRERTERGTVSQTQKPVGTAQTQARPNHEERSSTERAQIEHGAVSQAQPKREEENSTGRERTERGGLSQTRPGAAIGKRVVISDRDRRRLQEQFAAAPPHRVARFGFRVSVGAAVPRSVRLYPLPASVAAVVPQFRGYRYIADSDRIVIVEPGTFRVVAVLPYGEGFMGAEPAPGVFRPLAFSERQRAEIRERIHTVSLHPPAPVTFRLAIGAFVPPSVRLYAMPPAVVAVAPELRLYRYVVVRDRFVVVAPRVLRIVAILPM
jgi:hypothetical protein